MVLYFIAYFIDGYTVFNQHHSKEWPCFVYGEEVRVCGCGLLSNCMCSESYFRGLTHSDPHSASDAKTSRAVNSPGSMFFSFIVGDTATIPVLLNVPKPFFGNGNFLKLLKTWKKTTVDVAWDSQIAILVIPQKVRFCKERHGVTRLVYLMPFYNV